jgi:biopolymer transport protein ExbB
MGRYASSRFRLFLFAAMILIIGFALADSGFGQAVTPSANPPTAQGATKGAFSLVLENLDWVFVLILIASVAGLTFIIQGFMVNREPVLIPIATTNRIRDLLVSGNYAELAEFTAQDPTFVSGAINAALKRAPSFEAMKEAMETSVSEQTADQFRKIEYLNIIGNLGPLLGLLGTVLGMIKAFQTMFEKGGAATPADLAGGVSKALAHTMLGLLLAIPCLAAFGFLRTRVDRITVRGALLAEELLFLLKPQDTRATAARSTIAAPGARTVPPPPMPQATM